MTRGIPGLVAYHRTRELERNGVRVRLGPKVFAIAVITAASAPEIVADDVLFDCFWGDDPSGGPLWWETSLSVLLANARHKLAAVGVSIRRSQNGNHRGGHLGGYRAFDLTEFGLTARPEASGAPASLRALPGRFLPTSAGASVPAAFPSHARVNPAHDFADLDRPSVVSDALHSSPAPFANIKREGATQCLTRRTTENFGEKTP